MNIYFIHLNTFFDIFKYHLIVLNLERMKNSHSKQEHPAMICIAIQQTSLATFVVPISSEEQDDKMAGFETLKNLMGIFLIF